MSDSLFFVFNNNPHKQYEAVIVKWYKSPIVQEFDNKYKLQSIVVFLVPNQYEETNLLREAVNSNSKFSLVAINSLGPRWVDVFITGFEVVLNDPDETTPASIMVEFTGIPCCGNEVCCVQ